MKDPSDSSQTHGIIYEQMNEKGCNYNLCIYTHNKVELVLTIRGIGIHHAYVIRDESLAKAWHLNDYIILYLPQVNMI